MTERVDPTLLFLRDSFASRHVCEAISRYAKKKCRDDCKVPEEDRKEELVKTTDSQAGAFLFLDFFSFSPPS